MNSALMTPMLLILAAYSAGASASFSGPTNYPVGTAPVAVVVCDLNNDGHADLVIADSGDFRASNGGISILLGNGDGTFQPAATIGLGYNAQSIAIGDFNGDGKPDLVVVSQGEQDIGVPSSASILFGNGNGTFQPSVALNVDVLALSVAAADFNRDGKLDLLIANSANYGPTGGPGSVSILLGNGDGSFQPSHDFPVTDALSVTVADFNGDGNLDIATTSNLAVAVLLGNGDGTFKPAVNTSVLASGVDANSIVAADFNRDGNIDLMARSVAPFSGKDVLGRLLGNGDGTFQPDFVIPTGLSLGNNHSFSTSSVAVGDFDRDGTPDLVLLSRSGTFLLMAGDGYGTFQAPVSFAVGTSPTAIAVGDFNHDGLLDVVVTNGADNSVSVLLNTTSASALRTLSVGLGAGGGGTVTSNPPRINCGSNSTACTAQFAFGTMVTLTATPDSKSVFVGWNSDCSGSGTCSLTMDSDHIVSALFQPLPDFSFTAATPVPASLTAGQSASSTVVLNSLSSFAGTVSFACSVQPSISLGPTCSSLLLTTPANNSVTGTLMIHTTAGTAASLTAQPWRFLYAVCLLAGLVFTPLSARTERTWKKRIGGYSAALILFCGLLSQTACGGGSKVDIFRGTGGTPPGSYTIIVTGTSGSVQHAATLTITVN